MASDLDNTRRYGVPVHNTTKPSDSDQELPLSDSGVLHLPKHAHHTRTHSFPNVKHEKIIASNGLDGELSGLQKAATKTALPSSINRGLIAMERDEDDQYFHWVFHRHVGFTTDEKKSKTNQTQQISNGHTRKWRPQSTQALELGDISSSSLTTADTPEAAKLSERQCLLEELQSIRQQRNHLRQYIFPTLHRNYDELYFRYLSEKQSYQHALSILESTRTQRIWTEKEYQEASRWHVLSDTFFILHRGPFGTICGTRLGRSAFTMIGFVKKSAGSVNSAAGQATNATTPSIFSWGTSEHTEAQSVPHNVNSNVSNNHLSNIDPEKVIVPWSEINSALGQIVLLLCTLQNAPFSGISFQKHVLLPCGSFSKIGLLKRDANEATLSPHRAMNERRKITAFAAYLNTDNNQRATNTEAPTTPTRSSHNIPIHSKSISTTQVAPLPHEVTWYNLNHYEENGSMLSLGYYARRNFNIALEALLFCIAETCLVIEKRDMALAAPFTMRVDGLVVGKDAYLESNSSKSNNEATVGGLPLAYDPGEGERWTLACKYLLTNLKWVIAYAVKHVDR